MKRIISILCMLALLLSFAACEKKGDPTYTSPEEITVSDLKQAAIPQNMLRYASDVEVSFRYDFQGRSDNCSGKIRFQFDGELVHIFNNVELDSGNYSHTYFTSDMYDLRSYRECDGEFFVAELSERDVQNALSEPILYMEDGEITDCTKVGKNFQVTYDMPSARLVMTVDASGKLLEAVETSDSSDDTPGTITTLTFRYAKDAKIDTSLKEKCIAAGVDVVSNDDVTPTNPSGFTFAAKDLDGNLVTYNDFADAKLLMINFWEPWCGPCVSEMPDLQKLYEDYRGRGLAILGVFNTEDGAADIIAQTGVTYPTVLCDTHLSMYQTDAVPTTVFINAEGELVSEEPYVGARSYEDWEEIITSYLE